MQAFCRILALLFVGCMTVAAQAATITVTTTADSGEGSLRDAVATASAGDTIVFDPTIIPGTITLTSGEIKLSIDNLTIQGPGADQLTVSGNNASRVFYITGATVNLADLTVTGGNGQGSVAGFGGGILADISTTTFSGLVITGNTATLGGGVGGGLHLSNGVYTVTNTTIAGNTATYSGGVVIGSATATFTNTTISGNSNSFNGSLTAVGSERSTSVSLLNCTVAGNDLGIYLTDQGNTPTVTLKNTLVANTKNFQNDGGILTSQGNNFDSDGSSGFTNGVNGNIVGTLAAPIDPLLGPLAANGAPTLSYALLPGSPALDAGNNTGAPATDQRGIARPQNSTVDIGAFEAQTFALTLVGGSNQSTPVNTSFATPLQVNLKEGTNNLQGATITFTGPASGAGINPATGAATTDASGNASRTVTANTITGGPYTVAATTSSLTQNFSLTNTAGAANHLVFLQQPTNAVAGQTISPAVTVQILDQFGNLTASTANSTLAIGANPGGGTLSGTTTVAAVAGVATFNDLSIDKVGTGYTLTAASSGLTGATSSAFNITQSNTTTTITADTPDPSVVGQAVTVNYTVTVNAPGSGTPTGNVTVSDGVNNCTGTVAAGSCAITLTTLGSRTLTATYAGDANFSSSTSAGAAHTVTQGNTTTTITADTPDPSVVGQAVTVTYTVAISGAGAGTPTGNVTVTDGVDSCTGTVAAGSCAITLTTFGNRTLTATYAGDANFSGSTSAGTAHTVGPATTFTGPTATGTGDATATLTGLPAGCGFTLAEFIPVEGHPHSPPAGSAPSGVAFPHGLFNFHIGGSCSNGFTTTVTITYPQSLPDGTHYFKYGPTPTNSTPSWYVLPATVSGATVTFTLTDGALGDDDLAANGSIIDQGGPGVPTTSTEVIPTLGTWALLLSALGLLLVGYTQQRRHLMRHSE